MPYEKSRISSVRHRLLTGLVAVLPAALTVWVLFVIVRMADGIFQPLFELLFDRRLPGFGLLLLPILLYLIGMIVQNRISNKLVEWGEGVVNRLPIVGTVYAAVKQTVDAFSFSSAEQKFSRVVFVEYPRHGMWVMGFVTREMQFNGATSVALFVPTTPNPTSGVLVIVPEAETIASQMSLEEAAKFVISGGILLPEELRQSQGEGLLEIPAAALIDPSAAQ
jgi:uncharacterized membrane protein